MQLRQWGSQLTMSPIWLQSCLPCFAHSRTRTRECGIMPAKHSTILPRHASPLQTMLQCTCNSVAALNSIPLPRRRLRGETSCLSLTMCSMRSASSVPTQTRTCRRAERPLLKCFIARAACLAEDACLLALHLGDLNDLTFRHWLGRNTRRTPLTCWIGWSKISSLKVTCSGGSAAYWLSLARNTAPMRTCAVANCVLT